MKESTKLKVATAVTALFLAGISIAGLSNRGDDPGSTPAQAQSAPAQAQSALARAQQPAPVYSGGGFDGDYDDGYKEPYEEDED